jgi:hypothetical protein
MLVEVAGALTPEKLVELAGLAAVAQVVLALVRERLQLPIQVAVVVVEGIQQERAAQAVQVSSS